MRYRQVLLGAFVVAGTLSAACSSAFAWGCNARGNGTSYGYSHSYSSRSEAENRALRECRDRPNSGSCYIVDCNPNG